MHVYVYMSAGVGKWICLYKNLRLFYHVCAIYKNPKFTHVPPKISSFRILRFLCRVKKAEQIYGTN